MNNFPMLLLLSHGFSNVVHIIELRALFTFNELTERLQDGRILTTWATRFIEQNSARGSSARRLRWWRSTVYRSKVSRAWPLISRKSERTGPRRFERTTVEWRVQGVAAAAALPRDQRSGAVFRAPLSTRMRVYSGAHAHNTRRKPPNLVNWKPSNRQMSSSPSNDLWW